MKVAVVIPMTPDGALGAALAPVVEHLAAWWDLDVWCPSEAAFPPSAGRVLYFDEASADILDALAAYDLVVYALCEAASCARLVPIARGLAGLVVLVDALLTDQMALAEVAVEGSLGVVVPSAEDADRLDGRTLGSVTVATLPVRSGPTGGVAGGPPLPPPAEVMAYAQVLVDAGELALATKAVARLVTDLGARLQRLDLAVEPAVRDVVADLVFDLFDLA